jgi:hypothetical protein
MGLAVDSHVFAASGAIRIGGIIAVLVADFAVVRASAIDVALAAMEVVGGF